MSAAGLALLTLLPLLPAQGARCSVRLADGSSSEGTLLAIHADWSLTLDSGRIPGSHLVSLRTAAALPERPDGLRILLAGGDEFAGRAMRIDRDRLAFSTLGIDGPNASELSIPLSALAAISFRNGPLPGGRRPAETRSRDVAVLANGDRLEGTLLALDDDRLTLDADGTRVDIERHRLAHVLLSTELARTSRPRQTFARLVLVDGSRLTASSARTEDGELLVRPAWGGELRLPLAAVAALDLLLGPAVYLSELEPSSYEHIPYTDGGLSWPWRRDASVAGGDLRLQGGVHDRGIGMHSQARLSFRLDGGFTRFEALVGLDERTGKLGKARVRVLLDGQPRGLGWDGLLTAESGARWIDLPVEGAKELTLAVDHGPGWWDARNHVNWADARLIRKPPVPGR